MTPAANVPSVRKALRPCGVVVKEGAIPFASLSRAVPSLAPQPSILGTISWPGTPLATASYTRAMVDRSRRGENASHNPSAAVRCGLTPKARASSPPVRLRIYWASSASVPFQLGLTACSIWTRAVPRPVLYMAANLPNDCLPAKRK